MRRASRAAFLVLLLLVSGVEARERAVAHPPRQISDVPVDTHTLSNYRDVAIHHLALDLVVDFDDEVLRGSASLEIENMTGVSSLVLDTKGLLIESVSVDGEDRVFQSLRADPLLGTALSIPIETDSNSVRIVYETSPDASGLHWMTPEQAHQSTPYLYTQSEPVDARSWIPIQDTPQVRLTYDATITVPTDLIALMSADNPRDRDPLGVYEFTMDQPIPPYLIALAVADVEFRSIDDRTGVWARPDLLEDAAEELEDLPAMIAAGETIAGPYPWRRYDLLIMPPSYHLGGMEHPRLNFVTPTFISGDKSLLQLIAHELSHSWSGDLVTLSSWNDVWLNEGITTYLARRIIETVYGDEYADMLAENGLASAAFTIEDFGNANADTRLHADFSERDPNLAFSGIPYEKGYAFMRALEDELGRSLIDDFMLTWFATNQFSRVDDLAFVEFFERTVLLHGQLLPATFLDWIYAPGSPADFPVVSSSAYAKAAQQAGRFNSGTSVSALDTDGWSPLQLIRFLALLSPQAVGPRMVELDSSFGLNATTNLTLLGLWSRWIAVNRWSPGWGAVERYLANSGSTSGLWAVYRTLIDNHEASRAVTLYARYRPRYHERVRAVLDELFTSGKFELPSNQATWIDPPQNSNSSR